MMAKVKFVLIIVFVGIQLSAICQSGLTVLSKTDDGEIRYAKVSDPLLFKNLKNSQEFLREILKPNKSTEFYLVKSQKTMNGLLHEKFQQTFRGIRVEFKEYNVHKDKSGNIVTINGYFARIPNNLRTEMNLTFDQALSLLNGSRQKNQYKVFSKVKKDSHETNYDRYEIVIVKGFDGNFHLTYKAYLYENNGRESFMGYIDCESGSLVFSQILTKMANATGTGATIYSDEVGITTNLYDNKYYLSESSRRGLQNAIHTKNFNDSIATTVSDRETNSIIAEEFYDTNNSWSSSELELDRVAIDVHWGMEQSFDYFYFNHEGRNSIDGQGKEILSYVNCATNDKDGNREFWKQAMWDSELEAFYFGNGEGSLFNPFVTLDIVAHEYAHAISDYEIGFVQASESGALAESLSDMWGATIEQWVTLNPNDNDKVTWLAGEERYGGAARSLINPSDTHQPDTYGAGPYWENTIGCIPDGSNDNCYIHKNAGVGNYWYYLLVHGDSGENDKHEVYDVTGIGFTDASKILYELITGYHLSPESGYLDARNYSIEVADSLFGINSCQTISVINAWHAVGLGDPFQANISGQDVVCSSGSYFSIPPMISGDNIIWESSQNLSVSNSNTNSTFVQGQDWGGQGWIKATISKDNCDVVYEKSVWSGRPWALTVDPSGSPAHKMGIYSPLTVAILTSPGANFYDANWSSSGSITTTCSCGSSGDFYSTAGGTGYFYVTPYNSCGDGVMYQGEVWVDDGLMESIDPGDEDIELTISPNPAKEYISIDIIEKGRVDNGKTYSVQIIDSFSRIVKNVKLSGFHNKVNIQNLINGQYILIMKEDKTIIKKPFIIQN